MSAEMKDLTLVERGELAAMQLYSLEVAKTPLTAYDVAHKEYVDTQFNSAVSLAQAGVTALINGAGPQLDTLKELADALLNNPSLGSALTSQIANVQSAVTAEAASRAASDATQAQSALSETILRDGYRTVDTAALSTERAARIADVLRVDLVESQHHTQVTDSLTSISAGIDVEKTQRDAYRVSDRAEAKQANDVEIGERVALDVLLTNGIAGLRADAVADRSFVAFTQQEVSIRITNEQTRVNSELAAGVLATANHVAFTMGAYQRLDDTQVVTDMALAAGIANTELKVSEEKDDRVTADGLLEAKVNQEAMDRVYNDDQIRTDFSGLMQQKFDVSPYYSGSSEQPLTIAPDSFLYFGPHWRVRANNGGVQKRLQFEYSVDATEENFKVAVPFIRA